MRLLGFVILTVITCASCSKSSEEEKKSSKWDSNPPAFSGLWFNVEGLEVVEVRNDETFTVTSYSGKKSEGTWEYTEGADMVTINIPSLNHNPTRKIKFTTPDEDTLRLSEDNGFNQPPIELVRTEPLDIDALIGSWELTRETDTTIFIYIYTYHNSARGNLKTYHLDKTDKIYKVTNQKFKWKTHGEILTAEPNEKYDGLAQRVRLNGDELIYSTAGSKEEDATVYVGKRTTANAEPDLPEDYRRVSERAYYDALKAQGRSPY